MKSSTLISLFGIVEATVAFAPVHVTRPSHFLKAAMKKEGESRDIVQSSSFQDVDLDMDRVKDCAESFGKCSVKEIKQLKSDLHDKRLQNLIFGDVTPMAPEQMFEEKIFEEELSLQLNLLQEEAPKSYLFPEVEEEMDDLPHLKDGTVSARAKMEIEKEKNTMLIEELAEEGVLESLAICGLLGVLMFAPQFLVGA